MFRHSLSRTVRCSKNLSRRSVISPCSLFHTSFPARKYKRVDYDSPKSKEADAERARLVSSLFDNNNATTQNTVEPKVNYFSWKGLMLLREKAKDVMSKYGLVAIVSYSTLYITMAGSYFLLLDSGVLSTSAIGFDHNEIAMQFAKVLETTLNDPSIPAYVESNPRVATGVVALALSEVSEPIRLGILWFAVPKIAKLVGKVP